VTGDVKPIGADGNLSEGNIAARAGEEGQKERERLLALIENAKDLAEAKALISGKEAYAAGSQGAAGRIAAETAPAAVKAQATGAAAIEAGKAAGGARGLSNEKSFDILEAQLSGYDEMENNLLQVIADLEAGAETGFTAPWRARLDSKLQVFNSTAAKVSRGAIAEAVAAGMAAPNSDTELQFAIAPSPQTQNQVDANLEIARRGLEAIRRQREAAKARKAALPELGSPQRPGQQRPPLSSFEVPY